MNSGLLAPWMGWPGLPSACLFCATAALWVGGGLNILPHADGIAGGRQVRVLKNVNPLTFDYYGLAAGDGQPRARSRWPRAWWRCSPWRLRLRSARLI
ncbi:MAG: hypothetical protein ACLSGS_07045 [Adlercreutzia sp.]